MKLLLSSYVMTYQLVHATAFQPISKSAKFPNVDISSSFIQIPINKKIENLGYSRKNVFYAKSGDNEEEDDRSGMIDAFASFDQLSSNDFESLDDNAINEKKTTTSIKVDNDVLSDVTLGSADNDEIIGDQVQLYAEMYKELETEGEEAIYDNIMGEMTGSDTKSNRIMIDADGIGSLSESDEETLTAVELSQDTDEFMNRALKEAMDEVTKTTSNALGTEENRELAESILNDEDMMKEINAIFDRANDQLLAGVSEIRDDQAALTKLSADSRSDSLKNEERRLAQAEGSVERLVDKVKKETLEVEKAMEDLKKTQEDLMDNPLMKAADLKAGGIVKQGALVGTVLFTFRSLGEVFLLSGGPEHGTAAIVQGIIAMVFAAVFKLV
mmetsp:Transcript_19610/g.24181  ORF Transcript_19610/g.24181 Transcript_19610/m.24181 type:complete len:385 (-) Transcript_19610:42-1196(-)